jgi:hypothetical protein
MAFMAAVYTAVGAVAYNSPTPMRLLGQAAGSRWRGGRAVECTGLENRRPFTGLVSSNLTLSANKGYKS